VSIATRRQLLARPPQTLAASVGLYRSPDDHSACKQAGGKFTANDTTHKPSIADRLPPSATKNLPLNCFGNSGKINQRGDAKQALSTHGGVRKCITGVRSEDLYTGLSHLHTPLFGGQQPLQWGAFEKCVRSTAAVRNPALEFGGGFLEMRRTVPKSRFRHNGSPVLR
jgi:hypothetical protein